MRIETGVSRDGCNARNMLKAARKFGMDCKGYTKSVEDLKKIRTPAILHWNFNHFVVFEGFKQGKELTDFIKNARVIVLPSEWYENGPYSAMETMALGKPLIVSDKGGLPELVEDGKNGFIYSDFDGLKSALDKIIKLSKDEYSKFCTNSLEKAKEYFNPDSYIDELLKK